MTTPLTADAPATDRIAALDVVRGVAVGGILFANVFVFFGLFAIPADTAAALPTAGIDRWAAMVEQVLVQGKFYSIFSLLFGIGFGLQLSRRGDASVPRFRRRLRVLALIGAAHALLLWAGDILLLYALLGFTLPWFARRSNVSIGRWIVGLLAAPTMVYAVVLGLQLALAGPASDPGAPAGPPPELLAIIARMGTGGLADAFLGNLLLFAGRWIELVLTLRLPKVLGMFLLGLWLVRRGVAEHPEAHRAWIARWRTIGLMAGLPANAIAAWAGARWPYLSGEPGSLLAVAAEAVGYPMLAIGYAATVTLLALDGRRAIRIFAPVGRMALTNYLCQSLVCVTLAYGFGAGLWWRVGASSAMGIACVIVIAQIVMSRVWMSRFPFGPAEWVWRRLTYGPLRL